MSNIVQEVQEQYLKYGTLLFYTYMTFIAISSIVYLYSIVQTISNLHYIGFSCFNNKWKFKFELYPSHNRAY